MISTRPQVVVEIFAKEGECIVTVGCGNVYEVGKKIISNYEKNQNRKKPLSYLFMTGGIKMSQETQSVKKTQQSDCRKQKENVRQRGKGRCKL